jgi:hypothetical protein
MCGRSTNIRPPSLVGVNTLRPFAALGLYFWAKRKKWVMSPNIAQKSSKIPLQPIQWAIFQMGYFKIALGLKLQSRGEKQPKIAAGLIWAIRTGLFFDTNSCA